MSILDNRERVGSFTSSQVYRLMAKGRGEYNFGAGALTYIQEKQIEKRMGRSLSIESYSRATSYGSMMERFVFSLLGMDYRLVSSESLRHPSINGLSGSPDLIAIDKIGEIKNFYPKAFAILADALKTGSTDIIKSTNPAVYWQCVSNAMICSKDKAEIILFMPYESELDSVRDFAENYDGGDIDPWQIRWIYEVPKNELPYLPNSGYYSNLNVFEFIIPTADIQELTERVLKANELLNR